LTLYVAEAYGWVKQGTIAPAEIESGEWDGGYATNDGQTVSLDDARALADACERMLADPERVETVRLIEMKLDEDVPAPSRSNSR
jgi:hypothetical protein